VCVVTATGQCPGSGWRMVEWLSQTSTEVMWSVINNTQIKISSTIAFIPKLLIENDHHLMGQYQLYLIREALKKVPRLDQCPKFSTFLFLNLPMNQL
jgi:hypothetical protein